MTVRIAPETRKALDAVAAVLDRDRSDVVNEALEAYLETYRGQVRHIQRGVQEAKAGQFVAEAEVKKRIGRLLRR